MPLVQIKLIQGVFSDDQKQQMLKKVTDAMLSVEGENMREVTTVMIEEIKSGDWAIGGKILKIDDVKAFSARKQAKSA